MNLWDCSPEQLAELLRNFYIDVLQTFCT
jgi:hypothetical protein